MILEIQHETRFEYSEPVKEALTELRLEPASDDDQSCHSFHLAVQPAAEVFRYHDGFGNRVHHFGLLGGNEDIRILAASVVETPAGIGARKSAPQPCGSSAATMSRSASRRSRW